MLLHVVSTAGEGSEGDSTGGGKVDMLRGFQNKIQNHLDCDSCNLFIKVSEIFSDLKGIVFHEVTGFLSSQM